MGRARPMASRPLPMAGFPPFLATRAPPPPSAGAGIFLEPDRKMKKNVGYSNPAQDCALPGKKILRSPLRNTVCKGI